MKKTLFVLLFLFGASSIFAQYKSIATYTRDSTTFTNVDAPWNTVTKATYGGIRSVKITDDLDGDGKPEILATDYSASGRVNLFEYDGNDNLEIVWSSPSGLVAPHTRSTPRFVETGDLDGDGKKEIIFAVGPKGAGGILKVFEFTGQDNDFGTQSILDLPADQFVGEGLGNFNMEAERILVEDVDGDGKSELILKNDDKKVYILSISGDAPGFASWVIEGGYTQPENPQSGGSFSNAVAGDIDGDGKLEIVNHHWNHYGFWSIDVNGADDYTYPTETNPDGGVFGPYYYEFYKTRDIDAVAFMGLTVADVDGDGKDEIAGVTYPNYDLNLISQPQGADGVDIWNDSTKFSILKNRWDLSSSGDSVAQYWGCYSADLNDNGKDELLVGGFYGENVVAVEYNGSGDILDGNNYDVSYLYGGEQKDMSEWLEIVISDSAGIIDTSYSMDAWQNPGVMKMSAGDITGDGKLELALAYQTDSYDSTDIIHKKWNGSSWDETTSTIARKFSKPLRILQFDTGTGVKELKLNIVTPNDYVLEQNYPNPFNPTTNIKFSLPISKKISVIVYDMLGKEVKTIVNNQEYEKGNYEATWDGTNNFGSKVASGNYIATMKFGNFNKSIKMQLLK